MDSDIGISSSSNKRERYVRNWREQFAESYRPLLKEGMTILDVGSGRLPAIPVGDRPVGCRYLGLDISADELNLAPSLSYDGIYVQDLTLLEPSLVDQVDLVISWQVLEHIEPLADAVDHAKAYLKPGGHIVSLLSGRNAHFAIINRLIPERLGILVMERTLRRPADTVFRAHYDSCTYSGLSNLFEDWAEVDIIAHFRGAGYLGFSRILSRMYLAWEDWAAKSRKFNLATHYTVVARK